MTALEEENKQLKEALKMPTYAGVTAVAPQAEPAASDGAQPLPPPQGAPQARGAQGLQARQGEPSAFLYAQGVAKWSSLDNLTPTETSKKLTSPTEIIVIDFWVVDVQTVEKDLPKNEVLEPR